MKEKKLKILLFLGLKLHKAKYKYKINYNYRTCDCIITIFTIFLNFLSIFFYSRRSTNKFLAVIFDIKQDYRYANLAIK